jgi:hypothetical protein
MDLDADGSRRPRGFTRLGFVCLPDTVDPRVAKGSGAR